MKLALFTVRFTDNLALNQNANLLAVMTSLGLDAEVAEKMLLTS
jgi:hypothetical protein